MFECKLQPGQPPATNFLRPPPTPLISTPPDRVPLTNVTGSDYTQAKRRRISPGGWRFVDTRQDFALPCPHPGFLSLTPGSLNRPLPEVILSATPSTSTSPVPAAAYVAPASYEDLYRDYIGTIRKTVAKAGIDPDNVDDVATEIVVKFITTDGLAKYSPEYGNRKVRFSTYLIGGVLTYVRHHRTVQQRNARREGTPLAPQHDASAKPEEGHRWVEVMADGEHRAILNVVSGVSVGRDVTGVQFARDIVEHVQTYGRIRRDLLAEKYGVSEAAVGYWVLKCRKALVTAGLADVS